MDIAIGIITACAPQLFELASLALKAIRGEAVDPEQVRVALENYHKAADAEVAKMQLDHDATMKAAAEALALAQDTTLPK